MQTTQLVIVGAYFALIFAVGLWATRFVKDSTDFLLAGRRLGVLLAAARGWRTPQPAFQVPPFGDFATATTPSPAQRPTATVAPHALTLGLGLVGCMPGDGSPAAARLLLALERRVHGARGSGGG